MSFLASISSLRSEKYKPCLSFQNIVIFIKGGTNKHKANMKFRFKKYDLFPFTTFAIHLFYKLKPLSRFQTNYNVKRSFHCMGKRFALYNITRSIFSILTTYMTSNAHRQDNSWSQKLKHVSCKKIHILKYCTTYNYNITD